MKNPLFKLTGFYFFFLAIFFIPCPGISQYCIGAVAPDFSFQQSICAPKTIQYFTNLEGVKSYNWNFGDGHVSKDSNPTNTYEVFNKYKVTLTLKYENGCSDNIEKIIPLVADFEDLIVNMDTTICPGDSLLVVARSNGFNSCWQSPSFVKYLPTGDVVARPDTTTTYIFNVKQAGENLVANGNFSLGDTLFELQYEVDNVRGFDEGTYIIASNPSKWHPNFISCGDHTDGKSNMMIVNGSKVDNLAVWSQKVPVARNTNYLFSTWLSTVNPAGNPAKLQFQINGQLLDTAFQVTDQPCIWQRFTATWNSGNNDTATIVIVNKNILAWGNDFALDDIFFGEVFFKT